MHPSQAATHPAANGAFVAIKPENKSTNLQILSAKTILWKTEAFGTQESFTA